MRSPLALLLPLLLVAGACGGEATPTNEAPIAVRAWSERYAWNERNFSSLFEGSTVSFLGKALGSYADAPENDVDGTPFSPRSSSVFLSDGTELGTISLLDGVLEVTADGRPSAVVLDGVGYFIARPAVADSETSVTTLYATDGTAAGTRSIDRFDGLSSEEWMMTRLVAIGSGKTATLCAVVSINGPDPRTQIDCYRPDEAMQKIELGTIGLGPYDGVTVAQAGDRFYVSGQAGAGTDKMKLFSVVATEQAGALALKSDELPGLIVSLIALGDNAAALLISDAVASEDAATTRFDIRRLDADGTMTTLMSAPATAFGGGAPPFAGVGPGAFEAELSADQTTVYLSSYTNEAPDSTSWLYALVRGAEPRVLASGSTFVESTYDLHRAPDGRIGVVSSGVFSWIVDQRLKVAATAPKDHYFSAPILLADGSAYLPTYTTAPELAGESTPWFYVPATGPAASFALTKVSGTVNLQNDLRFATIDGAVYVIASREEVSDQEGKVVQPSARWLYRFVDGVVTELSIDWPLASGERRQPYWLPLLNGRLLLETAVLEQTGGEVLRTELFELLP
jgi:hypothetical protein